MTSYWIAKEWFVRYLLLRLSRRSEYEAGPDT
jgi:hypothetical protein